MSVKKFKFVSPGIFLNEIDNSQLAREPEAVGPTIIGRLQKGPGLVPLRVDSMSQFIEVFGNPVPGGKGGDIWREGNETAPTYAAYAAQAFLRNSGPVNVVRLLGTEDAQATSAGSAGWTLDSSLDAKDSTLSSVYGLYLFSTGGVDRRESMHGQHNLVSSTQFALDHFGTMSGTLGAIFYLQAGTMALSGNLAHLRGTRGNFPAGRVHGTGSHVLIESSDASKMEFNALLTDGTKAERKVTFNFDRNSDKYIRKVFNTNPTLTNSDTTQTAGMHKYFLGETFDRFVRDHHGFSGVSGTLHQGALSADNSLSAMIVPLHGTANGLVRQLPNQDSRTPWIFGQDLNATGAGYKAAAMQKLFRFCGINDGGWNTRYLKVSITDVKPGNDIDPYGTFSILVRRISDNDARPFVLERFSQCSLNPNSNNYVGRKVGDQYREWDDVDKRYRVYGNYPNQSSFFRVLVDQDVDNGVTDPALIPFGFYGPPRYKTGNLITHDQKVGTGYGAFTVQVTASAVGGKYITATSGSVTTAESSDVVFKTTDCHKGAKSAAHTNMIVLGLPTHTTASLLYPTLPLRLTASSEGLSNAKNSYFGVSTYRTPTDTKFDPSFVDVTRRMGSGFLSKGNYDASANSTTIETSFMFTLDDLVIVSKSGSVGSALGKSQGSIAPADVGTAVYVSGSRANDRSYTAKRGGYKDLVKAGFAKFTVPVYGGFDGFDITEKEPFRNSKFSSGDETTSYEIASLKRAIDSVSDPEVVEMNSLALPGITNTRVTNHAIRTCEDRADALAVIDIENGGYIPSTENKDDFKTRVQNSKVRNAVDSLENRGLDTSYACAFYPWVKISDQINGRQVWVPPSVTALGTFGSTQAKSELWFAPAGFTRGGLSDGAGGLPVLAVSQRVSSRERDELYEANINPIAQFPAEGIVVFGQKTLQATPSALDRINVRRLMIFVKKEISRRAATLLFDQNVQATWDRFRGSVEPFLDSVKSRFGLTEFKVVLDGTTTTPDLIDRNIMYAKIFLKPARAIEFIAIDFVITNSGASFED